MIENYRKQADHFETLHKESEKEVELLNDELLDLIVGGSDDKVQKAQKKAVEEAQQVAKKLLEQKIYFLNNIKWLQERFPNGVYEDVTGLCKVASLADIEEQDWSLNPGRYVGVVIEEDGLTETEFKDEMKDRHQRLDNLNTKADQLKNTIQENLKLLL